MKFANAAPKNVPRVGQNHRAKMLCKKPQMKLGLLGFCLSLG
jgi:hypothetical protein